MFERSGNSIRRRAGVVLLLAATLGLLLTMSSEPARVSAHEPGGDVFWLHCTETTRNEDAFPAIVTLKAPTDYPGDFWAYWWDEEWEATEADYYPMRGKMIYSTGREADLSEYMVFYENKYDRQLEGPERYWAYYTPTDQTDMSHWEHDNKCPITINDTDWLFTGVDVISAPTADTYNNDDEYYVGEVIKIAARLELPVTGVENDPTMRIWIGSDHRDVVYDGLSGDRKSLIFKYVVKSTDVDDNGIEISSGLKTDFTEFFIPAWPQGDIKYTELSGHKVAGNRLHPHSSLPTVSVTSTPSGNDQTYDKGEAIDFALTFPVAIDVRGYPALAIEVGDKNDGGYKTAIYKSGSGTETLTFTYTVRVGDRDDDGVTVLGTYYEDEFERGVLMGSANLTVAGTDIDVTPEFEALKNQPDHKVHAPGGL